MKRGNDVLRGVAAAAMLAFAGCGTRAVSIETALKTQSGVTSIVKHGNDIWAACEYHWLVRAGADGSAAEDLAAGSEMDAKDARRRIRWIASAGNDLLLATDGGVVRFSPEKRRILKTWTAKDGLGDNVVRWVGEGPGGMWAGTIRGASRLDPSTGKWRNYGQIHGLPGRHVYRMLYAEGVLWASCIGAGMARFQEAQDRWVPAPPENGLGSKFIYSMSSGDDGIWLGTAAGVNLYLSRENKWDPAVCTETFTDYCVYALTRRGDTLWFGTGFGLFMRNLSNREQKVYTSADGLSGNDVSSMLLDDDVLWVGTGKGLNRIRFRPD